MKCPKLTFADEDQRGGELEVIHCICAHPDACFANLALEITLKAKSAKPCGTRVGASSAGGIGGHPGRSARRAQCAKTDNCLLRGLRAQASHDHHESVASSAAPGVGSFLDIGS